MVVGALGVVFSIMTALSCEFIQGRSLSFSKHDKYGVFLGLEGEAAANGDNCSLWDGDTTSLDEAIRTCAVLAPIVATCALSITLFQMICCNICCSDIITSFALTASAIIQALTFLMYQTDYCTAGNLSCKLGRGGKYSIVASTFYFFCGVMICFSPKSEPLMQREKKDDKNNPPEQASQPPDPPDAEANLTSAQVH